MFIEIPASRLTGEQKEDIAASIEIGDEVKTNWTDYRPAYIDNRHVSEREKKVNNYKVHTVYPSPYQISYLIFFNEPRIDDKME